MQQEKSEMQSETPKREKEELHPIQEQPEEPQHDSDSDFKLKKKGSCNRNESPELSRAPPTISQIGVEEQLNLSDRFCTIKRSFLVHTMDNLEHDISFGKIHHT
jgi:hypothetical protein